MKEYDWNPYKLPEALRIAIGTVIAASAQTENVVEWAIAGCLGIDMEYGGAVTTHMQMPLKFSVLRSVAKIRIKDRSGLAELDRLIGDAERAFEKRNAIAHHYWCRDPATGELFMLKTSARKQYKTELLPVSIPQIEREAVFIYEVGMKLMSFLMTRGLRPDLPEPRVVQPNGEPS